MNSLKLINLAWPLFISEFIHENQSTRKSTDLEA